MWNLIVIALIIAILILAFIHAYFKITVLKFFKKSIDSFENEKDDFFKKDFFKDDFFK